MPERKPPFHVLLAEDSDHDVLAIQRAWRNRKIPHPLAVVRDGAECLDYLHQRGAFSPENAPRPGLLLLDWRMPRENGGAVLEEVRKNAELKRMPVVVLTASRSERDLNESYELGANAFVVKPVGVEGFADVLETIARFWEMASIPDCGAAGR
jgi:CheY-like chemotaxis protein